MLATLCGVLSGSVGCGGDGETSSPAPSLGVASVAVTPSDTSITVGATSTLKATLLDRNGLQLSGRTVAWASAEPSEVTVSSSGVVTAVSPTGAGSVVVTATSEGVSGAARVTVVPVRVASVKLVPASLTLVVGDTSRITPTALDSAGNELKGRAVAWTSSVPANATVSALGLVTAVAPGSSMITATIDGQGTTATVVVEPSRVASLRLTYSGSYLIAGDTLQARASPLDATGQPVSNAHVSWATSAPNVATVSDGVVTAVGPGTVTISATAGGVTTTANLVVAPGSGVRTTELAAVDSVVLTEMRRLGLPGGAVAIAVDDRLVFARGYGWADTVARRAVSLDNLFRIGSVSKPVTAVAVLKLVEQGRLSLEDHPFTMLSELPTLPGQSEDPRLASVTVRHLLEHAAGWDANRAVDDTVWAAVWRDRQLSASQIFRYGRGVPLVAGPGSQYGYTNYVSQVLGRLIEKVTGKSYETFVRNEIFAPMGITRAHLGLTPLTSRDPAEVSYYDTRPPIQGLFGTGTWPNVGGGMEYYDASGSWLMSAVDMMRFMAAVDGLPGRPDVLSASTIAQMTARPAPPLWAGTGPYYALGWEMTPDAGGLTWSHSGAADGGDALLVRRFDGVSYIVLFNLTRGQAAGGQTADPAIARVLRGINRWPTGDFFRGS